MLLRNAEITDRETLTGIADRMSLRSAVVVVVDRWGAGFLGPQGNTWLDTPAVNRLAARSLLCETVVADSPRLEDALAAYWTGRHVLEPRADPSLIAACGKRGVATVLVTDELLVAEHPLAAAFQQIVSVPAVAAAEAEESGMARLFAAAAEALSQLAPPYWLWIHSRGMSGPWDAPLAFREQFRDEEDPHPGDFTAPPEQRIERQFDPDELLKIVHAYAGQVSLLDQQLGGLMEFIEARREPELLLAVTSPRGYPLGEHGRIGPCDEALYGELLHVPLLVHLPYRPSGPQRTHEILQPHDLGAAIGEHFGVAASSRLGQIAHHHAPAGAECAVAVNGNQRAIRTRAWFCRETMAEGEKRYELFAKPDDRWEMNEVASRCGHEVELLAAALDQFELAARAGKLAELPPLPELLRDTWR